jgi:hypothetical protein
MRRLYYVLGILALLLVGDLVHAHFNKRVHHEIYFQLFDHNGKERKLRQDILSKRIKRNSEGKYELPANTK